MGILRSKSNKNTANHNHSKSGNAEGHLPDVKLTKEDVNHFKVRTASVHDPILSAVQEDQPFQEIADPNQRKSYLSMLNAAENQNTQFLNPDGTVNYEAAAAAGIDPDSSYQLTDIFGQPIMTPDISNPTRERDERPLDTIKSFEYAISGDPFWGQNLETQQFGFRVRPDFQLNFAAPQEIQYDEEGNPIQQANPYGSGNMNGSSVMMGEQGVYVAPAVDSNAEYAQKKKRGFFGRKKKN